MFETSGIGVEEVVAWIERDQFVYYVEMEHALGDPADWPRLRSGLVAAVTAPAYPPESRCRQQP